MNNKYKNNTKMTTQNNDELNMEDNKKNMFKD